MQLHKKLIIRGTMTLLTGLRIGDSKDNVDIGGVDLPVVRRKDNNQPYIPGSSIKGKIRSLLEVATGSNADSKFNVYGNQGLPIAYLFGWFGPVGTKNQGNPSRLLVRDAYLTDEWATALGDSEFTDMPYTEVKFENTINRLTGMTVDGGIRQVERIPAGAVFTVEFVVNIMKGEGEADTILTDREKQFLEYLKSGIRLLEHDYLGGSGSRGYGQVEFNFGNNWGNGKATETKPEEYSKQESVEPGIYSFGVDSYFPRREKTSA